MKPIYALTIVAVAVVALGAGWMVGRSTHPALESPEALSAVKDSAPTILYYRNPMGLPDTSPVPKKDSMGMSYIPVYADGAEPAASGTVVMSLEKVQRLGVRTEQVRRQRLSPAIRASATVQVDETREYVIAPKFEGWIERLYADQTGMSVRRGQALLSVYSPELRAAQDEFRVADAAAKRLQENDPSSASTMRRLRDASRSRLRNWDISGAQIARLETKEGSGNLIMTSPADAVILEKSVVQGSRFAPGETILKLADLSTVWLIADVPASSAQEISIGQSARFESPTLRGQTFAGRVTFIQPVIDAATRTLAVRIELPNPDGNLRPGLFGDATIVQDEGKPVLTVPRSAVLDSGTRQLVFVQIAEGRFEPRPVVLGERSGTNVAISEGLREGELVVTAANFLIDAESNLQSALDGFGTQDSNSGSDAENHSDHVMPQESPNAKPETSEPPVSSMPDHSGHSEHSEHSENDVPPVPSPHDHGEHEHPETDSDAGAH